MEILIQAVTAVLRAGAPEDAPFKPGDEVRLVGALPETLAGYDETWLRTTNFTVRYVSPGPMIAVQSHLVEDFIIATVPAAAVERVQR
ncbi:hypothetical protein [Couchioplanes azureus]|uniref:hypothetical protein n=1 Tax=Couchioplanes caeruleus TaxID=56438 RepID=UPI00166F8D7D|nr:hypothetical protein [Couchioplanes caeruleus]GGQ83665.1 hypothetical protein GCM10010166_62290 [Couchioplanes caeruleus subsp. azureus]